MLHIPRGYNFLRCSTLLGIVQPVWAKAVHGGVDSITNICWCRTAAWVPEALTRVAVWCETLGCMILAWGDILTQLAFFIIISIWNSTYSICSECIYTLIFKPIRQVFACARGKLLSIYKLTLVIWDSRFLMRSFGIRYACSVGGWGQQQSCDVAVSANEAGNKATVELNFSRARERMSKCPFIADARY